jgi:hypothetical protein
MHTNITHLELFPSLMSTLLWLCVLIYNVVKLKVEGNNCYQLWYDIFVLTHALSFNVTIAQISSKPKLCKFSLNFSFMNFYLDFHFMGLCFFLWFKMLLVLNNNEQNKMPICVYMILLLWWLVSKFWVSLTIPIVDIMLCMWGLWFLCKISHC